MYQCFALVFLLLFLFICPVVLVAQDLQSIQARSAEVRNLAVLACPPQGSTPTPRAAGYRDDLVNALKELRDQLTTFKTQVAGSILLGNAADTLTKTLQSQLDAIGDSSKDPCVAAAAFAQVNSRPSVGAPVEDVATSKSAIIFIKKEVGDQDEATISVTNKSKGVVRVIQPQFCVDTGTNCKDKSEGFELKKPDQDCPSPLATSEHCDWTIVFKPHNAGKYFAQLKVSWEDEDGQTTSMPVQLTGNVYVANVVELNGDGEGANNPSLRSIVGFDVSGASSAKTSQKAFVEFDLNSPIWGVGKDRRHRDPLNRPLWLFFNPRITSLPQSPTPLSNLNVQGFTDFFTGKNTDIVQGVDVQGGPEFFILKPRHGVSFFSSYKNAHSRLAAALVAGVGFTTPFSTPSSNPTVFTLPPNSPLRQQFNVPVSGNFTNIAFVDRERSRFFRKYYAGLRFKTFTFSDLVQGNFCDASDALHCEGVYNLFPGIIDLTVGQDEQVTAGHLSGWVFRLDAIYPLPFASAFHIFGSVNTALQKNISTNAVILPPTSSTSLSDPSVFIVNVDPRNRDIYRIGLGVDILQVLRKASTNKADQAKPTETPTAVETKDAREKKN